MDPPILWWNRWLTDREISILARDKDYLGDFDDDEGKADEEKYPASWTAEEIQKAKDIERWLKGAKSSL